MIYQTVDLVTVGYRMPTDSSVLLQAVLIDEKAVKLAYKLDFFV